jgi:hypothetical protein
MGYGRFQLNGGGEVTVNANLVSAVHQVETDGLVKIWTNGGVPFKISEPRAYTMQLLGEALAPEGSGVATFTSRPGGGTLVVDAALITALKEDTEDRVTLYTLGGPVSFALAGDLPFVLNRLGQARVTDGVVPADQ